MSVHDRFSIFHDYLSAETLHLRNFAEKFRECKLSKVMLFFYVGKKGTNLVKIRGGRGTRVMAYYRHLKQNPCLYCYFSHLLISLPSV